MEKQASDRAISRQKKNFFSISLLHLGMGSVTIYSSNRARRRFLRALITESPSGDGNGYEEIQKTLGGQQK